MSDGTWLLIELIDAHLVFLRARLSDKRNTPEERLELERRIQRSMEYRAKLVKGELP